MRSLLSLQSLVAASEGDIWASADGTTPAPAAKPTNAALFLRNFLRSDNLGLMRAPSQLKWPATDFWATQLLGVYIRSDYSQKNPAAHRCRSDHCSNKSARLTHNAKKM